MSTPDDLKDVIRRANCDAPDALRRRLWQDVAAGLHQSQAARTGGSFHAWRVVMDSKIAKLAAAGTAVLTTLVLWHAFGAASKAYALSDVPGIIRQARTIHICTRTNDGKGRWEHWYDIENAREYVYHEGEYQVTFDSPETRWRAVATVRDGPYVMKVDHVERTVRFERWLPSEQELHRLVMADFALNAALPDVLQYLDRYTKIGNGKIGEQSYDIWRREWKEPKSDFGIRYDIWVSPSTGEIGRTRQWINYNEPRMGWMLRSETDKIALNLEPPAGIFATEPPEGYVAENPKTTADVTSVGFPASRTPKGYALRIPASFMIEDGSILACWNAAGGPPPSDPNQAYEGLTLGGPLPKTSVALYGLLSSPVIGAERRYGSVSFGDENAPITIIHGVGRHLTYTRRAGRIYEWALYVPQEEIPCDKPMKQTIVAIKHHMRDFDYSPGMSIDPLTSLVVTPERLARYVSDTFRELSDDRTVPAYMDYRSLLKMATQIRKERALYEAFTKEVKETEKTSIGSLEPVRVTAPDKVK
jgi:hypothetical protein